MDINDLYDEEIRKIGPIWKDLMNRFSRKANTRANLEEFAKAATEEFTKIGLVVEVNTAPTMIYNPATRRYGSPEIVILGRIPGTHYEEEGHVFLDHEKKRQEVIKAKERGEDFLGQKGN